MKPHYKGYIFCSFSFEGLHCWKDAINIQGVEFLALKHRHMFHARVTVDVDHLDRDIEFILLKRYLEKLVESWPINLHTASCEAMALCIGVGAHCFVNGISHDEMYFRFPFVGTPYRIPEDVENFYSQREITVEVSEDEENGCVIELFPKKEKELE